MMEHISKSGRLYELGEVKDYGMLVIFDWDVDADPVKIVGFYLGDYDHETTEYIVEKYEKEGVF